MNATIIPLILWKTPYCLLDVVLSKLFANSAKRVFLSPLLVKLSFPLELKLRFWWDMGSIPPWEKIRIMVFITVCWVQIRSIKNDQNARISQLSVSGNVLCSAFYHGICGIIIKSQLKPGIIEVNVAALFPICFLL